VEMSPRVCWVLIDGVGDVGSETPLQKQSMDACDAVASAGVSGLMDPVQAGLACGSDTAHLSMFGYDPLRYYRGRGAFETMGAGLEMEPGDIAFKCNFACLDIKSGVVVSRRADRNFEDVGPTLCDFLDGIPIPSFPEHSVAVKYATEHRCGLRLRGPGLSDLVSGTDPLKDRLPLRKSAPLDASAEAEQTSRIINALSEIITQKLIDHPVNQQRAKQGKPKANLVLLRGCGARVKVPSFWERHQMKSFMIAPTCLIRGLGMSIEMDIINAPGATGDYHTDLESKANTALATFAQEEPRYDLGFVHVKAVDDAGHDRSAPLKLEFLKKCDDMVRRIALGLHQLQVKTGDPFVICVTGDHSTPVAYGDHSAEPVPFAIASVAAVASLLAPPPASNGQPGPGAAANGQPGPGAAAGETAQERAKVCDAVSKFSEITAAQGALGRFQGLEVMGIIRRFLRLQATPHSPVPPSPKPAHAAEMPEEGRESKRARGLTA